MIAESELTNSLFMRFVNRVDAALGAETEGWYHWAFTYGTCQEIQSGKDDLSEVCLILLVLFIKPVTLDFDVLVLLVLYVSVIYTSPYIFCIIWVFKLVFREQAKRGQNTEFLTLSDI